MNIMIGYPHLGGACSLGGERIKKVLYSSIIIKAVHLPHFLEHLSIMSEVINNVKIWYRYRY